MPESKDDKDKDLQPPAPVEKKPPRSEFATSMIAKYGTAENAIAELGAENVSYRERHNSDKEQIERLQTRITTGPKVQDGGKILSKDEAAAYDKYVALGKPEEVEKRIKEGEDAKTVLTAKAADEHIASVAKIAGYNSKVLADLARDKKFTISLVDGKVDGEMVKIPMATAEGTKDAVELDAFIDKNFKEYRPALEASGSDDESDEIVPTIKQVSSAGQGSRKGGATKNAVTDYQRQTYATPNGSRREEKK